MGCLGWTVIAAAAAAAWLSGGFGERVPVVSTGTAVLSSPVATAPIEPAPTVPATATQPTPAAQPAVAVPSPLPPPKAADKPPDPPSGRPMETTTNVRLRSSGTADAPIVTILKKGTPVEMVGSAGEWLQVNVPSLNVRGWVQTDYLVDSSPVPPSAPVPPLPAQAPPKPRDSEPRPVPLLPPYPPKR